MRRDSASVVASDDAGSTSARSTTSCPTPASCALVGGAADRRWCARRRRRVYALDNFDPFSDAFVLVARHRRRQGRACPRSPRRSTSRASICDTGAVPRRPGGAAARLRGARARRPRGGARSDVSTAFAATCWPFRRRSPHAPTTPTRSSSSRRAADAHRGRTVRARHDATRCPPRRVLPRAASRRAARPRPAVRVRGRPRRLHRLQGLRHRLPQPERPRRRRGLAHGRPAPRRHARRRPRSRRSPPPATTASSRPA